jgi:hypothetical protein
MSVRNLVSTKHHEAETPQYAKLRNSALNLGIASTIKANFCLQTTRWPLGA